MDLTLAALVGGLLAASIVQSATGFGYSLVAGPFVYAALDPAEAVALIMIVGEVVSLLILFGERRRPRILWRETGTALAAAVPGLPLGALLIRTVPAHAMTLAVGLIVCCLCTVRLARRGRARAARTHDGPTSAIAAGFCVGVLTTSTTTSGPPLAIWLTARRLEPAVIRDVVTLIFIVLDVIGLAVVIAINGADSLPSVRLAGGLAVVAALGQIIGRRLFLRLPGAAYEPLVLSVALLAGIVAIASVASSTVRS